MTIQATIYVVDDNDDHREIIYQLVKHAGYRVKTFSSSVDFLNKDALEDIGCILLDNQMPKMTGLEVQAELIRRNCLLPVIFVSGGSEIPEAVAAVQDGAVGFLQKPIHTAELLELVEKAVEKCRNDQTQNARRQAYHALLDALTRRERQVYNLVIAGNTNKMMAAELGIKIGTVEFHRANVMSKIGVGSFSELMAKARTDGTADDQ